MSWTKTLPFIAALATGGVPALMAAAATAISDKLGVEVVATPVGIDTALRGATPEQIAAIKQSENDLKKAMRAAETEDKRIDADVEKAYLGDVANARSAHGADKDILGLGIAVLITWAILMTATLVGLYGMLTNGIEIKDVGIVATVFTILGSILGYVSNNAQQVLSYYFGTSRGSAKKTDIMADAVGRGSQRGVARPLLLALVALVLAVAVPAASAKVIGTAQMEGGARLDFHDDAGPTCVKKARRAEFVNPDGSVLGGCWLAGQAGFFVTFFDGEFAQLPIHVVTKPTGA
jgi:hypothetical protein